MSWQLYITQTAEQDINNAVDYIDFVLKNPQAADALLDETERQLTGLLTFPEKFPLVNDPVLASKGVRFTLIKNHLAFYIILLFPKKLIPSLLFVFSMEKVIGFLS